MALTKLTTDLIDSTIVTSVNGSTGAVTLETGTDWQATPKTADFTAVAGEGYFVNTTSAAITVTLPSSPSTGDEVSIIDYGLNASTNNITITSSGNIEGASDDLVLSTNKISKTLVYSDATKGWLVTTEAGAPAPVPVPDLIVNYLAVAGGGGGGSTRSTSGGGGGGGAGGYRSNVTGESSGGGAAAESSLTLTGGTSYAITIGGGGAGGPVSLTGTSGNNSVFDTITSIGGGGGGGGTTSPFDPFDGGSGGGGCFSVLGGDGTVNQGFKGGDSVGSRAGAGGGGASSNGTDITQSGYPTIVNGTAGGLGVSSDITGVTVARAGGGGGGADGPSGGGGAVAGGGAGGADSIGVAGTNNTGGGGGGGGSYSTAGVPDKAGAAGGSGIVIVRYPDYYDITVGSGLTTGQLNTAVGSGEKYTTFTGGTGNITFGAA